MKRKIQRAFLSSRALSCDIEDTIVLVGSPRSGTTWLMEILSEASGYRTLHEPIEPSRYSVVKEAGFEWRTCIPPGANRPEAHNLMQTILSGRWPTPERWRFDKNGTFSRALEFATNRSLLVKFVRANRFISWLDGEFPVKGVVFLTRHPCAVVASMLRREDWFGKQALERRFGANYPQQAVQGSLPPGIRREMKPKLDRLSSRIEVLTALWCLDQAIPLRIYEGQSSWKVVTYERLMVSPVETLEDITE